MWSIRIAVAKLRPVDTALVVRTTVIGLVFCLFLWADFAIFNRLFRAAAEIEAMTPFFSLGLIENFLGLVFLVAAMTLFFSAMATAIGAFFMDADLELYHAAPVSRLRIVISRWASTYIQSGWLIVVFLLPLFPALARQYGAGLRFHLLGLIDLVAFISIPVTLASTLVILLVRYFPVRRVHQIAVTLGIVVLTLAVVGLRMARPERLFGEIGTDELTAVLSAIALPGASASPPHWLARTTASRVLDAPGWMPSLPLIALAALSFLLFVLVGRALYFTAWVRSKETAAPVMLGAAPVTAGLDRWMNLFDSRTRAMVGKEIRTITRDVTQWSQLFMMLALLFLYLYNIRMMPLEGDARAAVLAWLNLGMSGFVISAISLRFAYPSVSAEGKQFWVIRTSPVSMRRFLWVKVGVYLAPLLALSLLLTILANLILAASPLIWVYTVGAAIVITTTLVGMSVGLGALSPDFRSDNPVEVALSLGGLACMSLSLLYVAAMMFLFARPVQRFVVKIIFGVEMETSIPLIAAPLALALLLSAALLLLPLHFARVRLDHGFG
jgi:ABC-2 type transport system permease protein